MGDFLVLQWVAALAFAALVAFIAKSRGRNPWLWTLIGFFTGCFGLILVLVLPDLKAQAARDSALRREQRRLKELLAQERMKNQAFREHTGRRLDAHDTVLGLDTRPAVPELQAPASGAETPSEMAEESTGVQVERPGLPPEGWYVAEAGGDPEGPLALDVLAARIRDRLLQPRSLVWHPILDEWTPLESSPLAGLL